jgi:hypothetical protein
MNPDLRCLSIVGNRRAIWYRRHYGSGTIFDVTELNELIIYVYLALRLELFSVDDPLYGRWCQCLL